MTLRGDHAAGAAFILLGALVLLSSGDLPFGTLDMPGAGMLPKLVAGLMIAFAVAVMVGGGDSPPLASIDWSDGWHALQLVVITVAAVALYRPLGFLVTMALLLFALLVIVERRPVLPASAYAIGLTLFSYWLFGKALKSPLEHGILWF